jgi:hypothetical protein
MNRFSVIYLESQAKGTDDAIMEENDDLGAENEKKNYVYDHSKSFFRNLSTMIRDIRAR